MAIVPVPSREVVHALGGHGVGFARIYAVWAFNLDKSSS